MKNKRLICIFTLAIAAIAVTSVAVGQIRQVIKVIGVNAAVKEFADEINKAINGLSKHKDTAQNSTRVVTIMSVGLGGKATAIGAAQIMGKKSAIDQVGIVASPETGLFGNEIRIRALVPVKNAGSLDRVPGVSVTGIVDLKL